MMTRNDAQRERSAAIDGVRTLGILAVVAGHTWPSDAWVSNWLFSWHVPVFFLISGYLWNPRRTVLSELRKRSRTLLVPYVSWFLVVCAVWFSARAALGKPISSEPWQHLILGGDYISRPWSAFWFISALFVAAILMRVLQRWDPLLPWFVGILAVAWSYADPGNARSLPLAAGQGAVGMLFLCLGALLRSHRERILRPLPTGIVLIAAPLTLLVLDELPSLNMKAADLGAPFITLFASTAICFGLILVAEATESRWPLSVRRGVIGFARLGLPVILSHALVLGLLDLLGVRPTVLSFLIATIISTLLGWCLSRLRFGRIFL